MILNAKDLYETKYQLLVNKRENTSVNYLNGSKALMVLNTQLILMVFIKILKNTIQIRNGKY